MTERQAAYQAYLRSEHWRRLRAAAIERDKGKCVDCGSPDNLQVHHWQYRPSPYQTKLQDVYTVCAGCHEKAHAIKRKAYLPHKLSTSIVPIGNIRVMRHLIPRTV